MDQDRFVGLGLELRGPIAAVRVDPARSGGRMDMDGAGRLYRGGGLPVLCEDVAGAFERGAVQGWRLISEHVWNWTSQGRAEYSGYD